jgi:hypothetical protein
MQFIESFDEDSLPGVARIPNVYDGRRWRRLSTLNGKPYVAGPEMFSGLVSGACTRLKKEGHETCAMD